MAAKTYIRRDLPKSIVQAVAMQSKTVAGQSVFVTIKAVVWTQRAQDAPIIESSTITYRLFYW